MDNSMTKEESYADRRQLFKNIWETAMNIDDKDGNVIHKPKVIKTLRLGEVDRCVAGKKKKQRIKNLRVVCNKLLDFCDRQEADDMFYEQMAAKGTHLTTPKEEENVPRKTKTKKKAKKTKSLFISTQDVARARTISSDRKNELFSRLSRNTSPINVKRASFVCKSPILTRKHGKATVINNSVLETSRNSEKRNTIEKLPGATALLRPAHDFTSKRLFPINKVTIK